jgi:hypothetical protein
MHNVLIYFIYFTELTKSRMCITFQRVLHNQNMRLDHLIRLKDFYSLKGLENCPKLTKVGPHHK